jgi:hypothetical protein
VVEALDRASRDMEGLAGIRKRCRPEGDTINGASLNLLVAAGNFPPW